MKVEMKEAKVNHIKKSLEEYFFLTLLFNYSGSVLYIPRLSTYQRKKRNQAIRKDSWSGLSVQMLSEKYHLSKKHIYQVLYNESKKV